MVRFPAVPRINDHDCKVYAFATDVVAATPRVMIFHSDIKVIAGHCLPSTGDRHDMAVSKIKQYLRSQRDVSTESSLDFVVFDFGDVDVTLNDFGYTELIYVEFRASGRIFVYLQTPAKTYNLTVVGDPKEVRSFWARLYRQGRGIGSIATLESCSSHGDQKKRGWEDIVTRVDGIDMINTKAPATSLVHRPRSEEDHQRAVENGVRRRAVLSALIQRVPRDIAEIILRVEGGLAAAPEAEPETTSSTVERDRVPDKMRWLRVCVTVAAYFGVVLLLSDRTRRHAIAASSSFRSADHSCSGVFASR